MGSALPILSAMRRQLLRVHPSSVPPWFLSQLLEIQACNSAQTHIVTSIIPFAAYLISCLFVLNKINTLILI